MAEEEKPAAAPAGGGEEAQAAEEADAVKKKGDGAPAGGANQKFVLIVLAINVVVVALLALVVWKSYVSSSSQVSLADIAADKDGKKPEEPKKEEKGEGKKKEGKDDGGAGENFVSENFVVNLADSQGAHFVKTDVAIEVDDNLVKEEVVRLRPKIRDFINVILSSKTYEQIESADGRAFLREEIRNKINGYLSRGQVKDVYFMNFVVQ